MIGRFDGEFEFLSNFSPAPFWFHGHFFPTSEHAFQAMKTLDSDERARIAALETPGKAKRAGRKLALRPDWEEVKIDIMRDVVWAKFSRVPGLMDKLLATGDQDLVEGNHWGDKFWGVCGGEGENHLGRILMEVREIVRNLREANERAEARQAR